MQVRTSHPRLRRLQLSGDYLHSPQFIRLLKTNQKGKENILVCIKFVLLNTKHSSPSSKCTKKSRHHAVAYVCAWAQPSQSSRKASLIINPSRKDVRREIRELVKGLKCKYYLFGNYHSLKLFQIALCSPLTSTLLKFRDNDNPLRGSKLK